MTIAYCWRGGEVKFTDDKLPDGALLISNSELYQPRTHTPSGQPITDPLPWRDHIEACCRRAYDGQTLLVPGVPEADDENRALECVISFRKWVNHEALYGEPLQRKSRRKQNA